MEVLQVVSQNDVGLERYRARRKAQRDEFTNIAIASDEARDQGRTEGRDEGRAEGAITMIQAFQRLLKEEPSTTEELVGLPLDELRTRAQQLAQKLGLSQL